MHKKLLKIAGTYHTYMCLVPVYHHFSYLMFLSLLNHDDPRTAIGIKCRDGIVLAVEKVW